MSTVEERTAYLSNPFFTKHTYGDFSPFYITVAICTAIGVLLILLNIICGCCSQYSEYWQDRFTGNRWLVTFWTATPHKQPPIDLKELKSADEIYHYNKHQIIEVEPTEQLAPSQHRPTRPEYSQSLLKKAQQQLEQVELKQRESDI